LDELLHEVREEAVVCESGGLYELVEPGIFLFVNRKDKPIEKAQLLEQKPIIVENDGANFSLNFKDIIFKNKRIQLIT
jgi:hypothetical protein